jgi:hypothetical protein
VRERWWKLVTTDEPAVLAKSFLDAIVVEEIQGNGCLANSTSTDESNGCEVFSKANNLLDQLVASEAGRWWGRRFSRRDPRCTCETVDHMVFEIADLA